MIYILLIIISGVIATLALLAHIASIIEKGHESISSRLFDIEVKLGIHDVDGNEIND